jgi:glucose/mannose-6-phosphate isomerase
MMSLIMLGDFVSYYLGILNKTDPTPVKAIDYLKERLGKG